MFAGDLLLAYIGPDLILPLTSALAAISGVVLMFWRYIWMAGKKVVRFVLRRQI